MKRILLIVLLLFALFFNFERVSETRTNTVKTQTEPNNDKSEIIALKFGETAELVCNESAICQNSER